jgi:hypothetical protein
MRSKNYLPSLSLHKQHPCISPQKRLQINTQYEILSKPKIQLNQPPPNNPIPISVELPPESVESVHSKCP